MRTLALFIVANSFKIIYPVSIAAACFAMPEAALPFKLNFRAFVIFVPVVMLLVQLAFFVSNLLHQPEWWKKVNLEATVPQLDWNPGVFQGLRDWFYGRPASSSDTTQDPSEPVREVMPV